jgi:GDP/UDP-N,N'-diacetylbacillosamine 2-epimerase (hydrolysing)
MIGIITTARSDFGLLKILIKKIYNNKNFKLKIFVAGSHLSKRFGYTVKEIYNEKIFKIIKLKNISYSYSDIDIAKSSLNLFKIFLRKIKKINKIKYMIILGDRYELLPIANICLLKGIKIIHIHGGETTLGSIDNSIRNAISVIASFHLVATQKSKLKLISMGIPKNTIFNIGALGLEGVNNKIKEKNIIIKKYYPQKKKYNIVVSYHPETFDLNNILKRLNILFKALLKLKNISIIFTSPGADQLSKTIQSKIIKFCNKNRSFCYYNSLGHDEYMSLVKFSDLVIGNSSSGIIEAPSLKTPSLDIGARQEGRERAKSVFHVDWNENDIINKVNKILNLKKLDFKNPYYRLKSPSEYSLKILKKIL